MAHHGDQPVLPLAGESLEEHLTAAGMTLPQAVGTATEKARDLTARTCRTSWATALHRRRSADWPRMTLVPTPDDLAGIRLKARAAAAQLPAPIGPAVEAALEALISQVELELRGTSALTLAGELLDFLDQGPTAAAVDAGLWRALTTLSLAPGARCRRRKRAARSVTHLTIPQHDVVTRRSAAAPQRATLRSDGRARRRVLAAAWPRVVATFHSPLADSRARPLGSS